MKIIFTSSELQSPSFSFYSQSLGKINSQFKDVRIDVKKDGSSIDYSLYDVALFMGFKDFSPEAKNKNPLILTGVVEPRASQRNNFNHADFIIVNSIEARDYFAEFNENLLIYYTFPMAPEKCSCLFEKERLILGYHGNKIHLEAMFPRITEAIEKLNQKIPVELWAMYNIKQLGKWQRPDQNRFKFTVRHIQFAVENYAKVIGHTDIGLAPQLIPVKNNRMLKFLVGSPTRKFNESPNDYFLRFKETTNIGRHLVFAQYQIPVISDMCPSSCSFIEDGISGFLASSTEGWYWALKKLVVDKTYRQKMGQNFYETYHRTATHEVQNKKLISFIRNLINQPECVAR